MAETVVSEERKRSRSPNVHNPYNLLKKNNPDSEEQEVSSKENKHHQDNKDNDNKKEQDNNKKDSLKEKDKEKDNSNAIQRLSQPK